MAIYGGLTTVTLLGSALDQVAALLSTKQDQEQDLAPEERQAAAKVFRELQRVLKLSTRTDDAFGRPQTHSTISPTSFHEKFLELQKEIITHDAHRPLTKENVANLNQELFILDNSLRETTVGSVRGHALEEKHQIVDAIADTGLQEIILGAYGSKISVDSQIAVHWKDLGQSFDNTWGFSDAYDLESFEEEPLWKSSEDFIKAKREGTELPPFWTPTQAVKTTYTDADLALFKRAYGNFPEPHVFHGRKPKDILKESESSKGRIPMGLLMMAGYGICNAIIEVDAAVETFDYETCDLVERCEHLMQWCRDHFSPRQNKNSKDNNNKARVFINCRDFVNYHRSDRGLEMCLYLVDQLCRLPPHQRPFGFLMEDPTGWLWPDEVGRLTRMIRVTMERAGHPDGKFLVHLHMYFAMAEACVLSAMCNGADGVWAALCKTGAQVGHACSTITAVNMYRAGVTNVAKHYNLPKMCAAARNITKIVTHEDCPEYEEVYGVHSFDAAFMMWNVPSCRYAIAELMTELGIDERFVRLNEISLVSAIEKAMIYHFGESDKAGWNPKYCPQMWDAIVNHLVTGLSRDYNSPLGLGTLYALVSNKQLPSPMIQTMLESTKISDDHPTVIEFVHRWNRLCAKHLGEDYTSPICISKSILCPCINVELEPRLPSLPFKVYHTDFTETPAFSHLPKWFKRAAITNNLNQQARNQKTSAPMVRFEERLLSCKLFIQEANSLQALPLADDFVIRAIYHDFFGDADDWVSKVKGEKPRILGKQATRAGLSVLMKNDGNNAVIRMMQSALKRLERNAGVRDDLQYLREVFDTRILTQATLSEDPNSRNAIFEELAKDFDTRDSAAFTFDDDSDTEELQQNEPQRGEQRKAGGPHKIKRALSKEFHRFSPTSSLKRKPTPKKTIRSQDVDKLVVENEVDC